MKIGLGIVGDIAKQMREEVQAAEIATGRAMHAAGLGLKGDWRNQITSAGLGRRLSKTIRSQTFPANKESLRAAALVWSKAPEIISSHDQGVTIRSSKGFYLAIPLPAAGRGRGGRRQTPGEWESRRGLRLRFVYRKNKPSLLVAEARINTRGQALRSRSKTGRGLATVPIFVLVPQVKLSKRLDLARDADRWAAKIPGMIVEEWVEKKL